MSLDFVINRTTKIFQDFKNLASKFSCLDPKKYDNADNLTRLESLADIYSDVIESQNVIVQEFLSFQDMYSTYPNLSTLYRIFLTIPINSAGAEAIFQPTQNS